MLHSRGELLLMLDADGATKITDLEKLESQVCCAVIVEYLVKYLPYNTIISFFLMFVTISSFVIFLQ